MTYINEFISQEDRQKYKIDDLEKYYKGLLGPVSTRGGWTIDREKNSYLIKIKTGHGFDNELGVKYFVFYWQELDILAKFQTKGGGVPDGLKWRRYELKQIDMDDIETPQEDQDRFKRDYDLMINDLKIALIAYRDFGILSDSTQCDISFDF